MSGLSVSDGDRGRGAAWRNRSAAWPPSEAEVDSRKFSKRGRGPAGVCPGWRTGDETQPVTGRLRHRRTGLEDCHEGVRSLGNRRFRARCTCIGPCTCTPFLAGLPPDPRT
ncbi:hypothetical protein GCM10010191_23230 [Actinomadura vinacea]|uniref:Uncharacterized protein n=1 Tax=Actinomadura vinacea TaxID=115336 RepID=A0ABN3ISW6_9ACTN